MRREEWGGKGEIGWINWMDILREGKFDQMDGLDHIVLPLGRGKDGERNIWQI
jgi:hypothetical protein